MEHDDKSRGFFASRANIVLTVFLAIGTFLLITEHRAHLFTGPVILIGLLALCVGMHFFMHTGHGGRDEPDDRASDGRQNPPHQH